MVVSKKVAEAEAEIVRFNQQKNMSPIQCKEAQGMRTLRFPQVYDEHVLKRTFMQALPSSIKHRMHSLCSNNKHAALQKQAYEATSSAKLQEEARGVDTSNSFRSPPTVTSRHELVNMKVGKITSTQHCSRTEDSRQGCRATLEEKLQLLTCMEEP